MLPVVGSGTWDCLQAATCTKGKLKDLIPLEMCHEASLWTVSPQSTSASSTIPSSRASEVAHVAVNAMPPDNQPDVLSSLGKLSMSLLSLCSK